MAKFYGKNSGYLIKNDLKYYLYAMSIPLGLLLAAWLAFKFLSPVKTLWITLGALAVIATVIDPFVDLFKRKSNRFYRGWGGELDIKKELQNLDGNFSVFQDLIIGENKGNIDFVVTGPTGIFLLEVKSHKGTVDFNGYSVTVNHKNYDFLRQVHGQTWALRNYLKQQCGPEVYIHSVLVFSSDYASLHFGYNPISNVYLLQKKFLLELFGHFPTSNYPRKKVEEALLKRL